MKKKDLFIRFLAFPALILRVFCENLSVYEQAQMVKSIANELNCKSVLILTNNLDINYEIRLGKQINEALQLYLQIWSFKTFTHNLYSDEISLQKTLVIMEYNVFNMEKLHWISSRMSLSSFDWLILSALSSTIELHFKNIVVPIDCRFIISAKEKNGTFLLHEIYKVSRNSELIIKQFGHWSLNSGLRSLEGDIFSRRMDLRGHQFRFAVHNLSYGLNPCEAVYVDNGKQMIQCAYFQVWKDLGQYLNYTTKYVVIEDCYQNGTTGISTPTLEMIRTGEADSGEDGYIWSSSRLIHNQFFWPLFDSKIILVTKTPNRKFSFSSYVRPFSTKMWFAIISWLLVSEIMITATRYTSKKYFQKQVITKNEGTENLCLAFRAICYQGSPSMPEKLALRLAYLMVYLIPVLLIPSYSGCIISFLSVPYENIPFLDLDEFEKDGTYQLNALNNTFFQFFLMTDDKFESLRRRKLISTTKTISYEESFREICSTSVTYMFEWPLMTKYSINCKVFKFDLPLTKIFSSMAVRKNFPYLELFNRLMQKLITSGLNMKILEKNTLTLFKHKVNPFPQHYFQIKPFEIKDVLPLFAVLAVGISASILVLFIENHVAKSNRKYY